LGRIERLQFRCVFIWRWEVGVLAGLGYGVDGSVEGFVRGVADVTSLFFMPYFPPPEGVGMAE